MSFSRRKEMNLLQNVISFAPAGKKCERQWRGKVPLLFQFLSFALLLAVCFNLSVPAYAYSVVHIQASIDLATWEIVTGVVRDEVGLTSCSPEWKRMEKDVLEELSKYNYNSLGKIDESAVKTRDKKVANGSLLTGIINLGQSITGTNSEEMRVLTFPTKQENRNSSTSTDMESALNANNAIVFDLNQAFKIYCERNNIIKTPDATEMLTKIKAFMGDANIPVTGDYITYFASSNPTDATTTEYRWCVEKYPGSAEKITWSMLIVEAFTNFSLEGEEAVDVDNVFAGNPNQLTKAMVGFFSDALDSLRGILGLWSMDELLFNEGWRSKGYVGGIFPASWEPIIWALFMFTEIIAAMIVLVGIVMGVLKQAAATMNTIARIHAMSQIQDFLVCGLALALLPLALRMVIALSGNLVDIVSAMRPDSQETGNPKTIQEMVRRFSSSNGTIGGIIAQCLFFGAQVYFNFFYALRALSTAILIVMAPMMVSLITISSAKKQVTITWMKELLANILVQPIHTFCITVILLLPTSTHGFDNLIAIYALIPFTAMIRSLFFGPAGGFLDQAAGKGAAVTNGAITGAAVGAASSLGSGLFGIARDKFTGGGDGGDSESGDGSSSNDGGSSGGTNTGLSSVSAERSSSTGTSGSGVQSGATDAAFSGENGGAESGANGRDSDVNGSGESGSDIALAIANAQNGAASTRSTQFSSQGQSEASSSPKPVMRECWSSFKNSEAGQKIGRGLGTAARIGGGAILGGIGGAISGTGLHQIGNPISSAGDSLIANWGRQKKDDDKHKEENSQSQVPKEGRQDPRDSGGPDADLSRPVNQPVDLGSVGKRRANDSSGDQEMQVRDLNQKELDKQGISDIDDNFKTMEFTVKGDSQQAKELGAYADYLKSLPPEQRRKEVNDRGIEATRTDDGTQVRIDKSRWSQANDGAKISSWTNAKTGDTTMRIKSPEGGKVPSFTGSAQNGSVHPVEIPKATHANTSIRQVRNDKSNELESQEIPRPRDVEQKLIDRGITGKAAAKAAERVGAIRALEAQGFSPSEAARQSKGMVSHVSERKAEVSIPKAELSPAQTATMIHAVQAGEAAGTPSVYRAEYEPGTADPVFGQGDAAESTSFSGFMDRMRSSSTPASTIEGPAPSSVEVGPVSAPTSTGPTPVSTEEPLEVASGSSASSPMPAPSVSETNGVSSVLNQAPSTRVNPELAHRAAIYKSAKQSTGSSEQAFAATKSIAPPSAPAPARAPSGIRAEASGINMGRPLNIPAPVQTGSPVVPVSSSASKHQPAAPNGRKGSSQQDPRPASQPDYANQLVTLPISEGTPEVSFEISQDEGFPIEEISPEVQLAMDEVLDPGDLFDPFGE